MARAKLVTFEHDGKVFKEQIHIVCPGCKHIHAISPTVHKFNGCYERPTFTPSLLCDFGGASIKCHSYVTDGKIQFLDDCAHDLKGQTVDLPEIKPEDQ